MRFMMATMTMTVLVSTVFAVPPAGWQPVDQAVGDLDPLSSNMRVVQPGLRTIGEQTSLFRVDADVVKGSTLASDRASIHNPTHGGTTYVRTGHGFRALYARPDYLVLVGRRHFDRNVAPRFDGEFVELVPADTVYDLTPLPSVATVSVGSAYSGKAPMVDSRIDGRIDGRILGRAFGTIAPIRPALLDAAGSAPHPGANDIRRLLTSDQSRIAKSSPAISVVADAGR